MKDNGGPAFPFEIEHGDGSFTNYTGMTLRDWFAGQSIVGINPGAHLGDVTFQTIAEQAYRLADAMLKEREK